MGENEPILKSTTNTRALAKNKVNIPVLTRFTINKS